MYIKKQYGQSKVDKCLFCGKQATTTNGQGVPVCIVHKGAVLGDMKCICGEYLDIRTGKYGLFFTCMRCGIVNLRKALEINEVRDVSSGQPAPKPASAPPAKRSQPSSSAPAAKKNEPEVIASDDPRYFD